MKKRKYMLSYTLLYIALALGVWVYFYKAGKSLINTSDAYKQHINALMVYGKWLRSIGYGILHGDFSLKNYSFGIGYGADFYTSMQYYAVGDILNLPVAFIKTGAVYYYFQFLILLRPYLAGLTFTALCAHKGEGRYKTEAILTAALSYAFCGTVMFIGMWNPFFVNAMIILPMMILGADRILEGKSARLFVVSVALSAVTNFYFFYMCVVLTIGYVIISLCFTRKNVLKTIGIFWGCGFLGTAMSAVVFLPVVLAFLSNPRAGLSGHGVRALYEADYYKELFKNLITYIYKPMYDTELGLTFIAVPVLVYVLYKTKKDLKSTILLIAMTAMLAIPYAGYSMTGFSYMINRWSFAVELFLALKIAELINGLQEMGLRDRIVLAIGQGAYVLLLLFTGYLKDEEDKFQVILMAAGIVLLFIPLIFKEKARKASERVLSFSLMVLVIAGILLNGYFANAEDKGNLPNGYLEKTTAEGFLTDYENTEVKAVQEVTGKGADEYIRYTGRNLSWNAGMLDGLSSTQFYFSLANGAISDYMNKLAINEMSDFSYYGLDNRMAPLALAGVNVYSLRYDTPEEEAYVPADYERVGNYFNFAVFEAKNPITLGYTCDKEIDPAAFDAMTPVMRQEAMLTGVLTGETSDYSPEYGFNTLDFEITRGKGVKGEGNTFVVKKKDKIATISFAGETDAETYIYLKNLWCDTKSDMDNIYFNAYVGDMMVSSGVLSYKAPESQFYSGWHDYIVNLGSRPEGISRVEIVFPEKGEYSCDEIAVISEPNAFLLEKISKLSESSMYDINMNLDPVSRMTNKVIGTVTAEGDTNLVFTIPYDKGWSLKVDGEKKKLSKMNVMFLGTRISEGVHEIELTYHTPGLLTGFIISIAAILVFAFIFYRRGRKA